MADVFDRAKRSQVMGRIRSKNTKPEISVRRALHALGYRFRLHVADLPGRPDIVLTKHRLIINVQGCFWHQHKCLKGRLPASNSAYWTAKLAGNVSRDRRSRRMLRKLGWSVETVWECETRSRSDLELQRLLACLVSSRPSAGKSSSRKSS